MHWPAPDSHDGEVQIERYHVDGVVGTGSFATVYRALDPRLDSKVAVKVLAENWQHDPEIRARFGQEALLLRRVRTQHRSAPLVEVFDIDETAAGQPWFVMTFADRGTLAERMGPSPWPIEHVRPVVETLADAMTALHANGVVHRDLKPSNLLYATAAGSEGGEQLLVGDLGLAKDLLVSGTALTIAGGSPGYMAPEQADSTSQIVPAADIYAASIIVAELLTGSRDPAALTALPYRLGRELRRGRSIDAGERHPSAGVWRESILAGLAGAAPPVEVVERTPSSAKRGGIALGGIGRSVIGAVVGLALVGLLAARLFGGDSTTVDITGPTTATVADTLLLSAEVPDGGSHFWTFEDQRIDSYDLQITPTSPGALTIGLTYVEPNGDVQTDEHVIEVSS